MLTFRLKSVDLGSKGPFFTLSIYLYILLSSFSGPCLGGNLYSSLRVPVGLCYAHLPFQKHLFLNHFGWGCSLFGCPYLDFDPVLGLPVRLGIYFWDHFFQAYSEGGAISFNGTKYTQ